MPELLEDGDREALALDLAAAGLVPELLDVLGLVGSELDEPLLPARADEEGKAVAGPGFVRRLEVVVDRA